MILLAIAGRPLFAMFMLLSLLLGFIFVIFFIAKHAITDAKKSRKEYKNEESHQ